MQGGVAGWLVAGGLVAGWLAGCWLAAGWLLAGWLAAGWLLAGWLAACWLLAGWLADGWLAAGWPGDPGYRSHDVPALNKRSMLKDQLYMAHIKRSNKKINYCEPHFGGSIGAS